MDYSFHEAWRKYREETEDFWNKYHHENQSHRSVVSPTWTHAMTQYHYNLVENAIIRNLGFQNRGQSVLDVGCGPGWWLRFYYEVYDCSSYVGIDISSEVIQRMRETYRETGVPARFLVADIAAGLPSELQGAHFDVVNAIGVMFHIIDDEAWESAIANIATLLKDGGHVFFGGEFLGATYERGVMRKFRSKSLWEDALTRQGFAVEDIILNPWEYGFNNDEIRDNVLVASKTGA